MRELPNRPNVDQLRHQARELFRAATGGDERANWRIAEVSDQLNVAGAQLAIAREYGFSSWRQLVSEVERRRGHSDGFFDEFQRLPEPPPPEAVPNPWEGPQPGVIGEWVPWRIVLFKSEIAQVVLRNFEVQPSGLSFDLVAQVRQRALVGELLRGEYGAPELGVVFADGRNAASIDRGRPAPGDPAHPVLRSGRGGGNPRGQRWQHFWLWPLPPSGPLRWVMAWPKLGIGQTSAEVDASELHAAAAEAEQLW